MKIRKTIILLSLSLAFILSLSVSSVFAASTISTNISTDGELLVLSSTTLQNFSGTITTGAQPNLTDLGTNRIQFFGVTGSASAATRMNPDLLPGGGSVSLFEQSSRRLIMYGSGTGADATSIRQIGIGQALSFVAYRGEGTTATPTALGTSVSSTTFSTGHVMANYGAGGYDGTNWSVNTQAVMRILAGETWFPGYKGTKIDWQVTQNGTNSLRTVMTLDGTGYLGIGTTSPNTQLHVNGGSSATTTVDFGDQYSSNSKSCFNVKNNTGTAISFYFVGTSMIVEANRCR